MKNLISISIFFLFIFTNDNCFSQIVIPKTSNPPVIDGKVNDSGWESAALITDFLQREPNEGKPLTEKTEVFIAYDTHNIYFGVYSGAY